MSLIPFMMSDPLDDLRGPLRLFDQQFGGGMNVRDLIQPLHGHGRAVYNRPWRHVSAHRSGTSNVSFDKDGFSVVMDVHHFAPEEITVKHVNNYVVVEGKHKETPDDHGYVSRHFVRRYVLPEGVNADAIASNLSSDGVLTVTAPRVSSADVENSRTIPIMQTGAPAIKHHGKHPTLSAN